MKNVLIFDTSVCSKNMGDYIIMDSVVNEIFSLFKDDMIFQSYTHDKIGKASYTLNRVSNYSFVGGTNLLSSNMNRYNQWKINLYDAMHLKNVILMGVGWWQYQNSPNIYTKLLLRSVLSHEIIHSVRDSYTEKMLRHIGFENVINTGCPTMWILTQDHCKQIPKRRADSVVFTITDYNKNTTHDQAFVKILLKKYKNVYFWPQGSGDMEYLSLIVDDIDRISVLGGNLNSYDELLKDKEKSIDYIGTRLHAGIRALQYQRRSIIIGIDNRAKEKEKDFGLKVLERNSINRLPELIDESWDTDIKIKSKNIDIWKSQFV